MPPIIDVRDISRIAYGFMASQALFAALDLDVFTYLSEQPAEQPAASLSSIASHTGVAPNRLLALLTALVSSGLLEKEIGTADHLYRNSPASEIFLSRRSPKFYGDYLRIVNGKFCYPTLQDLGNSLQQSEQPPGVENFYSEWYSDPANASEFAQAQHNGSLGPAHLLANRMNLTSYRRLLDVGGGSGGFTITLCQQNPELSATILDFPPTVEVARRFVAQAGLTGRISHIAGSATHTEWQSGYDVILMSYLWSAVGHDAIVELVRLAYTALVPGGLLIVHDFMVNDELTAPPVAAWHLLLSTVNNPGSVCLTPALVSDYLSRGGFENLASDALLPGITSLVTATRI